MKISIHGVYEQSTGSLCGFEIPRVIVNESTSIEVISKYLRKMSVIVGLLLVVAIFAGVRYFCHHGMTVDSKAKIDSPLNHLFLDTFARSIGSSAGPWMGRNRSERQLLVVIGFFGCLFGSIFAGNAFRAIADQSTCAISVQLAGRCVSCQFECFHSERCRTSAFECIGQRFPIKVYRGLVSNCFQYSSCSIPAGTARRRVFLFQIPKTNGELLRNYGMVCGKHIQLADSFGKYSFLTSSINSVCWWCSISSDRSYFGEVLVDAHSAFDRRMRRAWDLVDVVVNGGTFGNKKNWTKRVQSSHDEQWNWSTFGFWIGHCHNCIFGVECCSKKMRIIKKKKKR